jgi:hypothetical protein
MQTLPSYREWADTDTGKETLESLLNEGMNICSGIAEENAIDTSKLFVIFQNWNQLHALERYIDLDSVDHGFADEYCQCACGNCDIAVRTTHNSYSWQPGFICTSDGEVLLQHADDADIETYIAERINDPYTAVNCPDLDLTNFGFREIEGDFESGWHPGQTDDPKAILKNLCEKSPDAQYLFRIDNVGQFDTRFSVWVSDSKE